MAQPGRHGAGICMHGAPRLWQASHVEHKDLASPSCPATCVEASRPAAAKRTVLDQFDANCGPGARCDGGGKERETFSEAARQG